MTAPAAKYDPTYWRGRTADVRDEHGTPISMVPTGRAVSWRRAKARAAMGRKWGVYREKGGHGFNSVECHVDDRLMKIYAKAMAAKLPDLWARNRYGA